MTVDVTTGFGSVVLVLVPVQCEYRIMLTTYRRVRCRTTCTLESTCALGFSPQLLKLDLEDAIVVAVWRSSPECRAVRLPRAHMTGLEAPPIRVHNYRLGVLVCVPKVCRHGRYSEEDTADRLHLVEVAAPVSLAWVGA